MIDSKETVITKENHRYFNLIWLVLYSIFVLPSIFCALTIKNDYGLYPFLFIPIPIVVCLFLVLPRRNNCFTLPIFLILGLISNLLFVKFYDLTWLFYPNFHSMASKGDITGKWLSASSWGLAFLIIVVIVYVFLSSFVRIFFKKSYIFVCFLIAMFLTGLVSYILFFVFPLSFIYPQTEIKIGLDPLVKIEFINPRIALGEKQITSVESATHFLINASGLSKGKRYGVRILTPENISTQEKSDFYYCWNADCWYNLGQANSISERLKPGIYNVQIITEISKEMVIVAEKEITVTALEIFPYDTASDYPCEMWLTLGSSTNRVLRIDVDSQEMTDIGVWVQCDTVKPYEAQITVGTIGQDVQYYSSTISQNGEPSRVLSSGGNVSHGYVRLIVDNQIMGEAIINRGFPICDYGKIAEGGNASDCK